MMTRSVDNACEQIRKNALGFFKTYRSGACCTKACNGFTMQVLPGHEHVAGAAIYTHSGRQRMGRPVVDI